MGSTVLEDVMLVWGSGWVVPIAAAGVSQGHHTDYIGSYLDKDEDSKASRAK